MIDFFLNTRHFSKQQNLCRITHVYIQTKYFYVCILNIKVKSCLADFHNQAKKARTISLRYSLFINARNLIKRQMILHMHILPNYHRKCTYVYYGTKKRMFRMLTSLIL
jgi:hypothetical protein